MKDFVIIYGVLDGGGVPKEMQNWVNSLSKRNNVTIITLSKTVKSENKEFLKKEIKIVECTYFTFWKCLRNEVKVTSYLCTFGYFNLLTLITTIYRRFFKTNIIFIPLGQITSVVLNNRIFSTDPDINKIKSIKDRKEEFLNKFKKIINPFVKKTFHFLFNRFIVSKADYIGCFSKYEKEQIIKLSKWSHKSKFLTYTWGLDNIDSLNNFENFYKKTFKEKEEKLNFVYWGRLDYNFKGLDLLIKGISFLKSSQESLKFRLYLMGPDYNNSKGKIIRDINKFNLDRDVIITTPAQYTSNNKTPLREADASILFSKWDGYPRSLRESVNFGIPILVSKETHFSDFISTYATGLVVQNIYDENEIAEALIKMSNKENLTLFKNNALKAREELLWDNQVLNFTKELKQS